MERYPITEKDKELIKIGLQVLANNFDDGVYNHTVGCAVLCKNGNIYKGVNCDGIHGLLFQVENVNLIRSLPYTKNIIIVLFRPVAIADKCCLSIVPILK